MTNKKRKLKYIREKNKLRKLGSLVFTTSFSADSFECDNKIKDFINDYILKMSKYYKLPLQITKINIGFTSLDFLNGTKTIRLTIKQND
jgi:hypothetical protein